MTEVKKFTISRKIWLRGEVNSYLLREDNKMCCVGIYLEACGFDPQKELLGICYANPIMLNENKIPKWLFDNKIHQEEGSIYHINDDTNISEEEREQKIKKIFLTQGIEVDFVD